MAVVLLLFGLLALRLRCIGGGFLLPWVPNGMTVYASRGYCGGSFNPRKRRYPGSFGGLSYAPLTEHKLEMWPRLRGRGCLGDTEKFHP